MARCKPLANIYDGAVNTFLCDNIVQNAVRDVFNFRRCYYQSGISAGFVIVIFFYFILETKIKAATSWQWKKLNFTRIENIYTCTRIFFCIEINF